MPRALRTCTTPGCPNLVPRGRCDDCKGKAEQARGSAASRGYGHRHRTRFRADVLRDHPVCQCEATDHYHQPGVCVAWSEHADHYPLSRRDLVARGLDPDDPQHGRGLCGRCHSAETAKAQPGGWNAARAQ